MYVRLDLQNLEALCDRQCLICQQQRSQLTDRLHDRDGQRDAEHRRKAYERGDFNDIRWIDGRDNPADVMIKLKLNEALISLITSNRLTMRI